MIPRSDDRHRVPAATVKLSDSFSHASDAGDKSLILQGNISDRGDFRQIRCQNGAYATYGKRTHGDRSRLMASLAGCQGRGGGTR